MITKEVEIDITLKDAWDDFTENEVAFLIDAINACGADYDDMMEALPYCKNVGAYQFLYHLGIGDVKEEKLARLIDKLWENREKMLYNEVDSLEQDLIQKRIL
jgi:GH24 family phage-related lysozyme (muramidase)